MRVRSFQQATIFPEMILKESSTEGPAGVTKVAKMEA